MSYEILTYQDAVDSCIDYVSGQDKSASQAVIRRAIATALHTCSAGSPGDYRLTRGRLHLKALQTTGTVTYDNDTRVCTLVGSTWPSWAADGSIKIGNVVSDIYSRDSDTAITLDSVRNPGEDITTASTYRLYKTCYHLPSNFSETHGFYGEEFDEVGSQVSMEEYFRLERHRSVNANTPRFYAIGGVQDLYGTLGVYVWPEPAETQTFDYLYHRTPRQLAYSGHDASNMAGTITISGSTVTGSGTSFAAGMVGSILRISSSTTRPSGRYGTNPFAEERVISSFDSTTSIGLDASSTSRSGVAYVVSDPVDLDKSWWDAFLSRCHYELALSVGLEPRRQADASRIYEEKKHLARCAANRGRKEASSFATHAKRRFTLVDN